MSLFKWMAENELGRIEQDKHCLRYEIQGNNNRPRLEGAQYIKDDDDSISFNTFVFLILKQTDFRFKSFSKMLARDNNGWIVVAGEQQKYFQQQLQICRRNSHHRRLYLMSIPQKKTWGYFFSRFLGHFQTEKISASQQSVYFCKITE